MGTPPVPQSAAVFRELRANGLLLVQDPKIPSVAAIVAGGAIRGSWWGHAKGREIFAALDALADHRDALLTKLVGGKGTWIHRRLWPALLGAAMEGATWQTRGLTPASRRLLRTVESQGSARAHGAAAAELERRLLVAARQVHTESGKHAIDLETWDSWRKRARAAMPLGADAGRAALELAARAIGAEPAALPWHR